MSFFIVIPKSLPTAEQWYLHRLAPVLKRAALFTSLAWRRDQGVMVGKRFDKQSKTSFANSVGKLRYYLQVNTKDGVGWRATLWLQ